MKYIWAIFLCFLALTPNLVLADDYLPETPDSLVPCGDGGLPSCQTCHIYALIDNVFSWIFGISFIILAIIIIISGLRMVTAGGNQMAKKDARKWIGTATVGFALIAGAWMLVELLIATLYGQPEASGIWSSFECVDQPIPEMTDLPEAGDDICSDNAALMDEFGGSPVGAEAPGLRDLISCYTSDPLIAGVMDASQIYTVDRSSPRCALTNGNNACGLSCSHSVNSCHYGRGSGRGARAVDFNAIGPPGPTPQEGVLCDYVRARQSVCGGRVLCEGDHTHVSMSGC